MSLTALRGLLAEAVTTGELPGAVFATGCGARVDDRFAVGAAQLRGALRPMALGTLFDLASLTKVVATTTSILALANQGALALTDTARRYLPGLRIQGGATITLQQLLTHTSGLPEELFFWKTCSSIDEARALLYRAPLASAPGARVSYSDLGFMLLGDVVAAVTGQTLDAAVRALVTEPLRMRATGYCPTGAARVHAAATEMVRDPTAGVGIVHDENARFFGGVAGHAGLFSCVDDLAHYARVWCDDGDVPDLLGPLRREACTSQTAGRAGQRGLGWACRGDSFDFLGDAWPASAVSHTGFTGTSIALDPPSGRWAVLLTNDVHFGRGRPVMRQLRRAVHELCGPLTPDLVSSVR